MLSRWRDGVESYEADVWPHVVGEIRRGDTFVDVGAFIGLYSIAAAQRAGESGKAIAFEPDPTNFIALKRHVRLNQLEDRVSVIQSAIGAENGEAYFQAGAGSQSRLGKSSKALRVPVGSLDSLFSGRNIDVLKIDVEGFELAVLQGSSRLLHDPARRPRCIFIEVHPFAWHISGSTSGRIVSLLNDAGYAIRHLNGELVSDLKEYGEIVARLES